MGPVGCEVAGIEVDFRVERKSGATGSGRGRGVKGMEEVQIDFSYHTRTAGDLLDSERLFSFLYVLSSYCVLIIGMHGEVCPRCLHLGALPLVWTVGSNELEYHSALRTTPRPGHSGFVPRHTATFSTQHTCVSNALLSPSSNYPGRLLDV